ncbi:hypothetical protein CDAR_54351 [Caerostris darwini]|uniref:Uncharacterized protein n=1 Tax=Caerostris darwini TaxID=1538125 RepID=A0AAV4PLY7_9ARAC|nr:hypothetical protein CDAR_54351 [Caerostris darwini]
MASHNRKRTGTAFRLMASPLAVMSSNSNLSEDFSPPPHFPPSLLRTDCRCFSFQGKVTGSFHLVKLLIVAPFPSRSSSASHNRKRTGTAFRLMAAPLAAMSSNSNLSKDFYSHFPPSLLRTDCRCLSFQEESGI